MDIDDIVAQHDSAYINGQKSMFCTVSRYYEPPEDDEDDESDDYPVDYIGTDGREWTVYLTRSQYEHALTLKGTERIRYLENG